MTSVNMKNGSPRNRHERSCQKWPTVPEGPREGTSCAGRPFRRLSYQLPTPTGEAPAAAATGKAWQGIMRAETEHSRQPSWTETEL